MRLSPRASLREVAVVTGDALRRAKIRAVLSGGACASLYTQGSYVSVDADFILIEPCEQEDLDRALASLGFRRMRDRYVHLRLPFFIEFPRGPLGIGEDSRIRPVWIRRRNRRVLTLSATDSCRDRLAAFYHWNDLQSLAAAAEIASRNRVSYAKIRGWSRKEGHLRGYEQFISEVRRRQKRRRRA